MRKAKIISFIVLALTGTILLAGCTIAKQQPVNVSEYDEIMPAMYGCPNSKRITKLLTKKYDCTIMTGGIV